MQTNIKRFYENTKNRTKTHAKKTEYCHLLKKIRSVTCMLKNTDSISLLKIRFYSFSFLGCFTTFAHVKINAPSAFGTPPPED